MVIDAVVTWVDGADKAHTKKRLSYFEALQSNLIRANLIDEEAALSTRFTSLGEIDFCLRLLLKFAPWLRTIYIVTDGQTPGVLRQFEGTPDANRFKVVDHREIFRDYLEYLPTFNSLSIESMLWRIKGLSEQFIYLNDDCFLLRALKPSAFFQDKKPVLRGRWKTQAAHKWRARYPCLLGQSKPISGHRRFQENSARVAGVWKKFWHVPHVPFPLLKQTFVDLFEESPEILLNNAQYPLRHAEQFWPISLAYHLGIQQQAVVLNNQLGGVSVNPAHHSWRKIQAKLAKAKRDSSQVFACIQSLDQANIEVQEKLIHWLGDL